MDKLQKEKNKIKESAKQVRKEPVDNIKEEIKENYEIGIEYYKDIENSKKKESRDILLSFFQH